FPEEADGPNDNGVVHAEPGTLLPTLGVCATEAFRPNAVVDDANLLRIKSGGLRNLPGEHAGHGKDAARACQRVSLQPPCEPGEEQLPEFFFLVGQRRVYFEQQRDAELSSRPDARDGIESVALINDIGRKMPGGAAKRSVADQVVAQLQTL